MRRSYMGLAAVVVSLLTTAQAEAQEAREAAAAEPLAPLPAPSVPPALTPPQPLPPPPPRFVGPAPRMVWVHVDAPQQVLLQFLSMEDTRWQPVCLSPCDLQVPLDGAYRAVAPGMVSSREVEIEAGPGDRVSLEIHVRTLAQRQTADRLRIAGYISLRSASGSRSPPSPSTRARLRSQPLLQQASGPESRVWPSRSPRTSSESRRASRSPVPQRLRYACRSGARGAQRIEGSRGHWPSLCSRSGTEGSLGDSAIEDRVRQETNPITGPGAGRDVVREDVEVDAVVRIPA